MTASTRTTALRWLLIAALAAVAGCSTLHLPGLYNAENNLIEYARSLNGMNAEEREAALHEALQRWEQTRKPRDRARAGLARGQWGHDGYDPTAAAEDLRSALAADSAYWRRTEHSFLELRAAQLTHLAEREGELNSAREANAQLQQALDEARRKLQAITDIERTLGQEAQEK